MRWLFLLLLACGPAVAQTMPAPVLDLNGSVATATGGTTARTLAAMAADCLNPISFGADPTGAALSTTAIQAAITAAQGSGNGGGSAKRVCVTAGNYSSGPLTVPRSVEIIGDGEKTTNIQLVSGSTAPLFTVATAYDAGNYYAGGSPPAVVTFRGLRLWTASNTDAPGLNLGHGIALRTASTNPVYAKVVIDHVIFDRFPGNGLDGNGFGSNGFVVLSNSYFIASQNGLSANSNYDWRISTCDFSKAVIDNIVISGAAGFNFYGVNSYSAGRTNLYIFSSGAETGRSTFVSGAIDSAQQHGVVYDQRGTTSPFTFIGTHFSSNGQSAAGTYNDIEINGGANNDLRLDNVMFSAPHSFVAGNTSLYNVGMVAGTQTVAIDNVWLEAPITDALQYGAQYYGSYYQSGAAATTAYLRNNRIDSNIVNSTTGYSVNGANVVGPRVTGWGTPSGGSRSALNGSSATLAQTSAGLAQLIADLTAHGLIGP